MDYRINDYFELYGNPKAVQELLDKCPRCKSSLLFAHISDYKSLIIQESARCPECTDIQRKIIYRIQ